MEMKERLIDLAQRLEESAKRGAQSATEAVVAMAIQDAKDAAAVRRTIVLLDRYGRA